MIRIEQLDDPRISPYRNLRDRTLRGENIFIAEGSVVVERMLRSRYRPESLLIAEEFLTTFASMSIECPLYVANSDLLRQIVGFNFHMGALAIGRRQPTISLNQLLALSTNSPCSVIVCPAVTKPENLGLLFRSAAAFNVNGIILGQRCCDPLSRRCVRVSMGAVLEVPFVRTNNILNDLITLRQSWQFERIAAVLDSNAEQLHKLQFPLRTALVFGNEFDGLSDEWLAECDRKVTIPMSPAVDSLNLGVAAGIFIHHWSVAHRT